MSAVAYDHVTGYHINVSELSMQTEWFFISKGVRQGCILAPYLFNLCQALELVDDIMLIAESKEDQQEDES